MRKGGLEPPRDFSHYHLKVACLPISPLPQKQIKNIYKKMNFNKTSKNTILKQILVIDILYAKKVNFLGNLNLNLNPRKTIFNKNFIALKKLGSYMFFYKLI